MRISLKSAIILATSALALFSSSFLRAQNSPVGTWDFVLSGHRVGTAYLTFYDDGTFYGVEVMVPNKPKENEVGSARNDGGDDTRTGHTSPDADFVPGQQIFGDERPSGQWFFDNKGRVLGYFIEVSLLENCVTNAFPFSTNTFSSVVSITETNGLVTDSVFCITKPIASSSFPIATNSFGSADRVSETNLVGGNVVCITSPTSTNSMPTFTNLFTSGGPIRDTKIFGDSVCITTPVGTNTFDGNFTNQTICYSLNYTNQEICYNNDFTEQTICYTNIIRCTALTNAISFVGKAVPNRRFTLVCTTPFGKTTYRGVPARALPDISGDWYGLKTQSGVTYQEFFSLSNSFSNIYNVGGAGPGYSYHGIAILSAQKKLSFSFGMDPPIPTEKVKIVRAVSGPFNARTMSSTMKGYEQPNGIFTNRITFKATKFGP